MNNAERLRWDVDDAVARLVAAVVSPDGDFTESEKCEIKRAADILGGVCEAYERRKHTG